MLKGWTFLSHSRASSRCSRINNSAYREGRGMPERPAPPPAVWEEEPASFQVFSEKFDLNILPFFFFFNLFFLSGKRLASRMQMGAGSGSARCRCGQNHLAAGRARCWLELQRRGAGIPCIFARCWKPFCLLDCESSAPVYPSAALSCLEEVAGLVRRSTSVGKNRLC